MGRSVALTTPTVTEFLKSPSGEPIAITDSPGLSRSEFPSVTVAGTVPSVFRTAISEYGSVPMMIALERKKQKI